MFPHFASRTFERQSRIHGILYNLDTTTGTSTDTCCHHFDILIDVQVQSPVAIVTGKDHNIDIYLIL